MAGRIEDIVERIRTLEAELEAEVKHQTDSLSHDFEEKRIRFEREILEQQKRFKMGLIKYLCSANLKSYLAAPFIYSLICPLICLDIFISIYQWTCFPLFGIKKIKEK